MMSALCTELRPMQKADLPRVLEVESAAYSFPWTQQIFQDCLQVGYTARVLELDARIIGYGLMSIAADEAQLLNLCIHPDWQGHGYGQQILKHFIELAKQKNAQSIFLEVRTSNQTAINLYHKIGFNQVGLRKQYYRNGTKEREDALIFAMEL
jgi:[ribosomal protein S18]-alanine N-acetyltransferase